MLLKPGLWIIVNKENMASVIVAVKDLQKGTIQAAFASANTTLAPSSVDSLHAYQSGGSSAGGGFGGAGLRYSSVRFGKRMTG